MVKLDITLGFGPSISGSNPDGSTGRSGLSNKYIVQLDSPEASGSDQGVVGSPEASGLQGALNNKTLNN